MRNINTNRHHQRLQMALRTSQERQYPPSLVTCGEEKDVGAVHCAHGGSLDWWTCSDSAVFLLVSIQFLLS